MRQSLAKAYTQGSLLMQAYAEIRSHAILTLAAILQTLKETSKAHLQSRKLLKEVNFTYLLSTLLDLKASNLFSSSIKEQH